MDKAHKKANETRRINKALRDAQRAEYLAQERKDKALVLDALRAILKDPGSTSAQRIYAVAILDNMMFYHIVPYSVKYPETDKDEVIAAFAKELEAFQEKAK